jgi:hypothetical protein
MDGNKANSGQTTIHGDSAPARHAITAAWVLGIPSRSE